MMKLIVLVALVAVAAADVSHLDLNAQILRQSSDVSPDGSYSWGFEAENGIAAQEQGALAAAGPDGAGISAQGSYHYTAPDGTPVEVSYVANENGFQPSGAVLPTPPPIPVAIQRSLEWIAAHPEPQLTERQNQRF